ncbi:MAG: MBL fold metallo-hydrolase [Candidatus Delongbacteria bacterium]|nr:MBL fold metallo-hydrolase [Candidatus Delongbacteria bacterium]
MKIKFLQAFNGDAILITIKDEAINRNVLIDGGNGNTYSQKSRGRIKYNDLFQELKLIKENGERIDLLILTHVDDDHIGGILKWIETDKDALDLVRKVWFNSGRTIKKLFETDCDIEYDNAIELNRSSSTDTSIAQGVKFEDFLKSQPGIWDEKIIKTGDEISIYGLDFKILSPDEDRLKDLLGKWTKEEPDSLDTSGYKDDYKKTLAQHIQDDTFEEDTSKHNGSSISFILSFDGKNYLFLADSFPNVVVSSMKALGCSEHDPLKCEFVKVAHHGSKANNNNELLRLIDSNKYVISTNGAKHSHPNKQFLARLINQKNDCEIYFNYPDLAKAIFSLQDKSDFPDFRIYETSQLKTTI